MGILAALVHSRVPALTASAAPASGSSTGPASSFTFPAATITPAGGVPGYTYAWATIYNSFGGGITFSAPSAAISTVRFTGIPYSDDAEATITVTITDSLGNITTVDIPYVYHNNNSA